MMSLNATHATEWEELLDACYSPFEYLSFYDKANAVIRYRDREYAIDYNRKAPPTSKFITYTFSIPPKTLLCKKILQDKSPTGLFFNYFMYKDVCDTHGDSVFFTNSEPLTLFVINSSNLRYLHANLVNEKTTIAETALAWLEEFTGIGISKNSSLAVAPNWQGDAPPTGPVSGFYKYINKPTYIARCIGEGFFEGVSCLFHMCYAIYKACKVLGLDYGGLIFDPFLMDEIDRISDYFFNYCINGEAPFIYLDNPDKYIDFSTTACNEPDFESTRVRSMSHMAESILKYSYIHRLWVKSFITDPAPSPKN